MMTPERRAEIEGKLDDPILGRNLELEECLAEIDRLLPQSGSGEMSELIGHRAECRYCSHQDRDKPSRCRSWPTSKAAPWTGDAGLCGLWHFCECPILTKGILGLIADLREANG